MSLAQVRAAGHLLSFIAKGEGGYESSNRGTIGGRIRGSTHRTTRAGKKLTELTLREVLYYQSLPVRDPVRLFAVGRYQIIPGTMREILDNSPADLDAKFDSKLQDELGRRLIFGYGKWKKQPALTNYLLGRGSLDAARLAIAREWASMPNPKHAKPVSYYGHGNRALHTHAETIAALKRARSLASGSSAPSMEAPGQMANVEKSKRPKARPRVPRVPDPELVTRSSGVSPAGLINLPPRQGSATVRALQSTVNRYGGFPALVTDGILGPRTVSAVKSLGLKLDTALRAVSQGKQLEVRIRVENVRRFLARYVKRQQSVVEAYQTLLNMKRDRGAQLVVDGIYGPLTHTAALLLKRDPIKDLGNLAKGTRVTL